MSNCKIEHIQCCYEKLNWLKKSKTKQNQNPKQKLALARQHFSYVEKQTMPSYKTPPMAKATRKSWFLILQPSNTCNLQSTFGVKITTNKWSHNTSWPQWRNNQFKKWCNILNSATFYTRGMLTKYFSITSQVVIFKPKKIMHPFFFYKFIVFFTPFDGCKMTVPFVSKLKKNHSSFI